MSEGQRTALGLISALFLVSGLVGTVWLHIALSFSAIVIFGSIMCFLAVLGYWPDKISIGQNSIALSDSQEREVALKVLETSAESATNVTEAEQISEVINSITQQNSDLGYPIYSYSEFEENLLKSLSKRFSISAISLDVKLNGIRIDYALDLISQYIYIETKFVTAGVKEFKGVTLDRLIEQFPADSKILIVSNASDVEAARQKLHKYLDPKRAEVVSWRSTRDDEALFKAITKLAYS